MTSPAPPLRLAYLLSRYPTLYHTYLLSEVLHLRRLGVELHVASVESPDRPDAGLTAAEREEARRTFYIKAGGLRAALPAHLAVLATRPAAYLRGLCYALSLGGGSPRRTLSWFFYFAEAVAVGRWMARAGLSHAHVHYASGAGLILARVFPVTVSHSFHGPAEFQDPAGFRLAEKIRFSSFVRAISRYGASQIMAASPYSEWDKIEVSRLGVDPAVFTPRAFREAPRPFEIVSVGRLSPEKGHHVLLAAVDLLVRQSRDVRLHLVGDGPGRPALERDVSARALAGRVVFHGWQPSGAVRALYGQADLCAMASFQEGIPVALMEAMAMEVPCVATRITGIPELIRDGVEGLLAAPSGDCELAAAIARLMDSADLRRQMGEAARRRVVEEYDMARNTARLAAVFARRAGVGPTAPGGPGTSAAREWPRTGP